MIYLELENIYCILVSFEPHKSRVFVKLKAMISCVAPVFAAFLLISSAFCAAPIAVARDSAQQPKAAVAALPGAPLNAPPLATPAPITAVGYVVMDLDSGRVLDARNPDKRLFPASTTKLMTCLVATEKGDLNQIIRASARAAATGESGIGLLAGENHTLKELLEAALVHSANDSCVDMAEGISGTQDKFVALMNAKAKQLGAHNTHFVNPHGLHEPNHYTTPRDLALIAQAVTHVPVLNEIADEKTVTIGGNAKIGPTRLMLNRNKLLWRWDKCDGLKTGYTKQAGNCLVATATMPDPTTGKPWRLLAVTMKSTPGHSFEDGETLLKRAFKTYRPQQVGKHGASMWQGQIAGGAFPLEAVTVGQARLPLRDKEAASLKEKLEMPDLKAPIAKGARVGNAVFWAEGKPIARFPLIAASAVPETLLAKTVPGFGQRIGFWSPIKRYGTLFLLGAGTLLMLALIIARRRAVLRRRRKRARAAQTLEVANLPRDDSYRPAPRPTRRS